MERRLIMQALEMSGGVRTNAAKLLRLTLRSLRYRMQKLEMEPADGESDPPSGEPPSS
jgi:two-component system, NtrC family, response regulator PilR